jgi:hypothetical protein
VPTELPGLVHKALNLIWGQIFAGPDIGISPALRQNFPVFGVRAGDPLRPQRHDVAHARLLNLSVIGTFYGK